MSDINICIPVELTAAMILRAGVVKDEARALALANELHDVVNKFTKLRLAEKRSVVEHPEDAVGDAEPVEIEPPRGPNAREIAGFTLAAWRNAMTGGPTEPDEGEAQWISEELAALSIGDDNLYLRWLNVCDNATGSDLATLGPVGGMQ
jgi:hypothetical protein